MRGKGTPQGQKVKAGGSPKPSVLGAEALGRQQGELGQARLAEQSVSPGRVSTGKENFVPCNPNIL